VSSKRPIAIGQLSFEPEADALALPLARVHAGEIEGVIVVRAGAVPETRAVKVLRFRITHAELAWAVLHDNQFISLGARRAVVDQPVFLRITNQCRRGIPGVVIGLGNDEFPHQRASLAIQVPLKSLVPVEAFEVFESVVVIVPLEGFPAVAGEFADFFVQAKQVISRMVAMDALIIVRLRLSATGFVPQRHEDTKMKKQKTNVKG